MYWNLQDRAWVHTDGWPCDGAAELAERAERQAAADQAFYDEGPRDQAPGPAEVYAAVTLDAISRAGDLAYAVYVVGLYRRDPREHVSGADALHPGCRYGGTEGAPCTDPERSDQ